jgi:hypothetical protein
MRVGLHVCSPQGVSTIVYLGLAILIDVILSTPKVGQYCSLSSLSSDDKIPDIPQDEDSDVVAERNRVANGCDDLVRDRVANGCDEVRHSMCESVHYKWAVRCFF